MGTRALEESKIGEVFPDGSLYASREETFPHSTTFLRKVLVEEGLMQHIKERKGEQ
jgi:TorA maturation chaperone TorD